MYRTTIAAAAVAALAASSSLAAPINYGDFSEIPPGAVIYTDVTEDSGTDDPPLYGEPEIAPGNANELDFDPSGFAATSTGGPLDITDGQLNFGFYTLPGAGLDTLEITEGGDFTFAGVGGAGTTVTAEALVTVNILAVDHELLVDPIVVTASNVFAADMATEGAGSGFWENGVLIEFGAVLPSGWELGVTKAEVVINNQLVTNSELDSLAFIAKKDFTITPGGDLTPFIPEPATVSLLAVCGFAGLGCRRVR